jgi:DNA helicase-2/ATP-dependent DNA helicase PcrA
VSEYAASFAKLNEEQRQAVVHEGNTVVLAGPGSGKTATLVLKVYDLLHARIRPPRGLACITYNHDAAGEFRTRLRLLGVQPDRRLFLGTVHGFCLHCVIRPLAALAGRPELSVVRVVMDRVTERALAACMDAEGVNEKPYRFRLELTRIRRALALSEPLGGFGQDRVRVAQRFEAVLSKNSAVDFEAMVLQALNLIRESAAVRELLSARFPWVVVDEYQDLGGPLHGIVTTLQQVAGVKVFAVGDPHQSIYGFNGADPKYLNELAGNESFRTIRLRFNYRSGRRLMHASQAALSLDAPLDYSPDPARADPGDVFIHPVDGDLETQAQFVVAQVLPAMLTAGVPPHEIAILYRQKGRLLDAIVAELARAGTPFTAERDERMPRSPIISWLRRCARWAVDNAAGEPVAFSDLCAEYHRLCEDAGDVDCGIMTLAFRSRLYAALDGDREESTPLADWLRRVGEPLRLNALLTATATRDEDLDALSRLTTAVAPGGNLAGLTLAQFARDARVQGKVVVTTYHSSKGRQFDAMILPGLQEGLMPQRPRDWQLGGFREPTATSLSEDRRLFYVGLTRAKRWAHLLFSRNAKDDKGNALPPGPSRLVTEVQHQLL